MPPLESLINTTLSSEYSLPLNLGLSVETSHIRSLIDILTKEANCGIEIIMSCYDNNNGHFAVWLGTDQIRDLDYLYLIYERPRGAD